MVMSKTPMMVLSWIVGSGLAWAQDDDEATPEIVEEAPSVTEHEINLNGDVLRYDVTTGQLPIKTDTGEVEGEIFFMAYTLKGTENAWSRPLTFSFNGGPGSASVWLHLGMLGPRRVEMLDDGGMPAPPYRLVDNERYEFDLSMVAIRPPYTSAFNDYVRRELGYENDQHYIHEESLAQVKSDITSFYADTKSMGDRGAANVPGAR